MLSHLFKCNAEIFSPQYLNKNVLGTFKMNLFHKSHLYISHKFF